jgi:hypothetical protein
LDLSIVSTVPPSSVDTKKDKNDDATIIDASTSTPVSKTTGSNNKDSRNDDTDRSHRIETIQEEEENNNNINTKEDEQHTLSPLVTQDGDVNTTTDTNVEPIEAVLHQRIALDIFSPDAVSAPIAEATTKTPLNPNGPPSKDADNTPLQPVNIEGNYHPTPGMNNDPFDDDDLLPPPPPPDNHMGDDDDEDERLIENFVVRQEYSITRTKGAARSNTLSNTPASTIPYDDKYDVAMEDFDDDEKDGTNFDIINSFSADENDKMEKSNQTVAKQQNDDLHDTDDELEKTASSRKSRSVRFDESSVAKSIKPRKGKDDKKKKGTSGHKRKLHTESESDSNNDDALMTIKVKKKKQNNNPYSTVFESHGIPQQRTFTSTAVSDLKQPMSTPSKGENNLRRSSRVRIQPLEFWRGEYLEYGPNDFGDEYDGVTNMSVPLFIHRANPTPYKQRKPGPRVVTNTKKKNGSNGVSSSPGGQSADSGLVPFDASHLAKKFQFADNGVAHLWDQVASTSKDTSKYKY